MLTGGKICIQVTLTGSFCLAALAGRSAGRAV